MRSIPPVIVCVACGGSSPRPVEKPAPQPAVQPACPDDTVLVEKFRPLYATMSGDGTPEDTSQLQINIVSCVWGHWAGPGFLVHHSMPEGPQQEAASAGGVAIVRADGSFAASRFDSGVQHVTVEGVDLDGDGNDEIFEHTTFDGRGMAPWGGGALTISRVVGKEIVLLDRFITELQTFGIQPAESCTTTLELRPSGAAKHIVITSKVTGDQITPQQCLAAGRHELVLDGAKLKKLEQPATE